MLVKEETNASTINRLMDGSMPNGPCCTAPPLLWQAVGSMDSRHRSVARVHRGGRSL